MAEHYESWSDHQPPLEKKRRRGGFLGWFAFVLALGGAGAFVWYVYLPLRAQRGDLVRELDRREERAKLAARELAEKHGRVAELERQQQELSGELVRTQADKERIEAELKRLQGELSKKLEPEIQAGNVQIKRRGNDLVVDLADGILFDSGQAELHESGKEVLAQVSGTLAALADYTIKVAGHTDATRVVSPATQERFPTNWELSTARATNVVRYLQESGKVPGERLVATGFAQYRPAASNASAQGRKQNRRIELVLMRR